ncbi:hypothetical protein GI584_20940 [Gracilibacillus salitolerans]|uniref:Uncharacterized protein n=1 Tax=Gracilibacillus salitolerans TaxID=2663022 RepID=A0A5Q2TRM5_9BACI|nr:hypothetical protein [Gracilibacillus salitolerans]QGH36360.1 hypothetical protein GI584_20940 [Gracilibacillus salitolerans]
METQWEHRDRLKSQEEYEMEAPSSKPFARFQDDIGRTHLLGINELIIFFLYSTWL